MPNRLDLPPDLELLIEKREAEDRRQEDRRDTDADVPSEPQTEHRTGADRRTGHDRRTE